MPVIISSTVRFWLLLIFLIPSILCSLFVLYYLLFDRKLRRALNNHVIIVVLILCLICQITVYPWALSFFRYQNYWPRAYIFCAIWGFIDWGFYTIQLILLAWASIERHILIFHTRLIATQKKRLIFHYFPLVFLACYGGIFYSIVYFFPPCENFIHYTHAPCIDTCIYNSYIIFMQELIFHQILPNLTIVISSNVLIVRVLWQKHRLHQRIEWRKHRKMTIQLLAISLLYLIFCFPNTFMIVMYLCGLPKYVGIEVKTYAEFFSYLVILFLPFVCVLSLPELRKKILPIRRRTRTIVPRRIIQRNHSIR